MHSIWQTNKTILQMGWMVLMVLFTIPNSYAQNPFEIRNRDRLDTLSYKKGDSSIFEARPDVNSTLKEKLEMDELKNDPQLLDTSPQSADSEAIGIPPSSFYPSEKKESQKVAPSMEQLHKDSVTGPTMEIQQWWIYAFDFLLLLLLLGAFLYDKTLFPLMQKAFRHENFLRFLYRDTYIRKPTLFIYLNIIFILCSGFYTFRVLQYFGQMTGFRDYLIIQGVVFLLYIIKHVSLHLLSLLVDKSFEVKFYQYWLILSAGMIGVWMIPVILMISVLPFSFLKIALILTGLPIGVLLIYRQVKAYIHANFYLYKHLFQIILYFCAVEVVPIILFADILTHY